VLRYISKSVLDKLCLDCPLKGRVKARIVKKHDGGLDVLFVGEAPGVKECEKGQAFVGPSGQFMDKVVERLLPGRNVAYENVCMCAVKGGREKPSEETVSRCLPRLQHVLKLWNPRVVVLLGGYALRAFGIEGGVVAKCGDVLAYSCSEWSGTVICSLHPAFVLRSPGNGDLFSIPIQKAASLTNPCRDEIVVKRTRDPKKLLEKLSKRLCALDLETRGYIPHPNGLLCASVAWRDGNRIQARWWPEPSVRLLRSWFMQGERIIHNAKFELSWIKPSRLSIFHDTMLRAGFVNENEPKNLNHLVLRYVDGWPYWEGLPDPSKFADVPIKELGTYCAYDSAFAYKLWEWQEGRLDEARTGFLQKTINPMAYVLWKMEEAGVQIDAGALEELQVNVESEIVRLEKRLGKRYPDVNWGSPKQVRELLFDKLKLPVVSQTKGGESSTSKEVIEVLAKKEKGLKDVIAVRNLRSKVGRVINPIMKGSDDDGRIHTTYNLGFTVTGRLSSSGPNLQNLERAGEEKKCFISRFEDGKLVKADYSQYELRLCAGFAKDRLFTKIFAEGGDPHAETAERLETDRYIGKIINLGLIYGLQAKRLGEEAEISERQAEKFRREWFSFHPDIARFHAKVRTQLMRQGFVTNMFGRKRHLPAILSNEWLEREKAVRQAVNFLVQGAAADIISTAMVILSGVFKTERLESLVVMQIHDELVIDSPLREVERISKILDFCMCNAVSDLYIPLAVDIEVGDTLAKGEG